jgi:E3 ubiquitin-protein ligase UBR4
LFLEFQSFIKFNSSSMMSTTGSDDEGSNAATEGSTLRTSPAEHAGSVGSESGGSGVDSIGGASGRSSNYGDQNQSPPRMESKLQSLTVQEVQEEQDNSTETENTNKLHVLR